MSVSAPGVLLLDLGNSRLKAATLSGAAFAPLPPQAWASGDSGAPFIDLFAALPRPGRVLAASVVDADREARLAAVVHARFDRAVEFVRTPDAACGVTNAYRKPSGLGIDRFLAMIAARAAGWAPCVLAGCGTALTLDALRGDGRHLGGLIAPSPALMRTAVLDASARVHTQADARIVDVADNTADALESGCWQAAAALVGRFAERMRALLGDQASLCLHGGWAMRLAPLLEVPEGMPVREIEHAVLRGLAAWSQSQDGPSR